MRVSPISSLPPSCISLPSSSPENILSETAKRCRLSHVSFNGSSRYCSCCRCLTGPTCCCCYYFFVFVFVYTAMLLMTKSPQVSLSLSLSVAFICRCDSRGRPTSSALQTTIADSNLKYTRRNAHTINKVNIQIFIDNTFKYCYRTYFSYLFSLLFSCTY